MEKSNGKEQWKRAMEKSNGKEVEMFWFEYVILNRRDEIPFSLSPSQDLFIDNSCRFILPALPGLFRTRHDVYADFGSTTWGRGYFSTTSSAELNFKQELLYKF